MSKKIEERKRKVDIEKLPVEQAELIAEELGKKIGQIGDEACAKINEITAIYGLTAKFQIKLVKEKKVKTKG